jgi:hypothetical protein
MIAEIEQARQSILKLINNMFDRWVVNMQNQQQMDVATSSELIVPLSNDPRFFVNKKPTAVLFGDTRVEAKTWTAVLKEILHHCNQDPIYHDRLMNLRGKAAGKIRVFLSGNKTGMTKPIEISEGLFVESHYGSQTMMHILTQRILVPIRYDYSDISIALLM